jgi:hypothetical protein
MHLLFGLLRGPRQRPVAPLMEKIDGKKIGNANKLAKYRKYQIYLQNSDACTPYKIHQSDAE